MSKAEASLTAAVERHADGLRALSRSIHAEPELAFAEYRSLAKVAHLVETEGFQVERGVAGLDTAFTATYGAGELVIGLCAEYDALPELGHACGHNIIAASSAGAALALRGVAQVAVGLLRQHLASGQMVHGIVTHGGAAPNIVPADTSALYYVRAPDVESLHQLETRLPACFEAGALATGCAHKVTQVSPVYADLVPDSWLAAAYRVAITGLGRAPLAPQHERDRLTGSTDMGNVTRVLPAIHPTIAIDCGSAVNHQPEFATACATPSADRAVCDGALALALTGLAAATDDAQRKRSIDAQREQSIDTGSRHPAVSETTAGGVL